MVRAREPDLPSDENSVPLEAVPDPEVPEYQLPPPDETGDSLWTDEPKPPDESLI